MKNTFGICISCRPYIGKYKYINQYIKKKENQNALFVLVIIYTVDPRISKIIGHEI